MLKAEDAAFAGIEVHAPGVCLSMPPAAVGPLVGCGDPGWC